MFVFVRGLFEFEVFIAIRISGDEDNKESPWCEFSSEIGIGPFLMALVGGYVRILGQVGGRERRTSKVFISSSEKKLGEVSSESWGERDGKCRIFVSSINFSSVSSSSSSFS